MNRLQVGMHHSQATRQHCQLRGLCQGLYQVSIVRPLPPAVGMCSVQLIVEIQTSGQTMAISSAVLRTYTW